MLGAPVPLSGAGGGDKGRTRLSREMGLSPSPAGSQLRAAMGFESSLQRRGGRRLAQLG